MSASLKQERIHNARHMTRNATAAFGVGAMVRVSRHRRVIFEVTVAAYAHHIRLVAELQGRRILLYILTLRIMAVRIVASAATHLSFPEALRTLQCFDNERGLAKSAVLVETLAGEISKRNPQTLAEEMIGGQIVQFARWPRRTNRRLHVALRADAYEITIANVAEIYRRIERLLRFVIPRRHIHDVLQRGAMAHLAIDARLLELQIVRLKTATLHIAQLAGMTNGADGLVAGRGTQFFP